MTSIILSINIQFSELEELGYKGFANIFHGAKSQLVGTSSILQTFTTHLLEYIHAVLLVYSVTYGTEILNCPLYAATLPPL